jgi:hypothetical protein
VIRVFSGATAKRLLSFAPFGAFTGGVTLASAPSTSIVAGQGPGGGAQVSVFDGRGVLASTFLGDTGSGGIAVGAG